MKTEKITVNKTPAQPDGVEIEIVQPETDLEGRLLSFLVSSHLRYLQKEGRFTETLPETFTIDHRDQGTFVINRVVKEGEYYEQPRPTAIVGIRTVGRRFDIVHAKLPDPAAPPAAPATASSQEAGPASVPAAPLTGTTDAGEPMIFSGAEAATQDDDTESSEKSDAAGAAVSGSEKEKSTGGRRDSKSGKSKAND